MDESGASSTSDKPLIEKLGLGTLITATEPLDPVTTPDVGTDPVPEDAAEGVVKEMDSTCDESTSIERELYQLTIVHAEIDAALERLEADILAEEGKGLRTVEKENLDEERDAKDGGSVEEQNNGGEEGGDVEMVKGDHRDGERKDGDVESVDEENEFSDERTVEGEVGEMVTTLGRHSQNNGRRRVNYPMRPDAEDCAYYMKTGSCKFGVNCKFNHPPKRKNQGMKERVKQREENSEKAGQIECKYYLTPGGCRYGKDCKYSHGSDRSYTSYHLELNFLGLPIRPGEKECPYYMRTGSCKYGSNCRFHHPDPKTVTGDESQPSYDNDGSFQSQLVSSSSISQWSPPRAYAGTSPFVPVMFPPTQGSSSPSSEWNGYQAVVYPTSEGSLPTPPAFAINNLPAEINFPTQYQHNTVVEEYPERPGEPECNFFLRTGDCKYRFNCKFHHPKNRNANAQAKAKTFDLNDKGLPLRPDEPICTHYHRFGICKYGPACKYDHPSKFGMSPPSLDQPLYSGAE